MVWHRHSNRRVPLLLLHDDVAAFSSDFYKTVLGHDFADFFAREDTQFRHFSTSLLI